MADKTWFVRVGGGLLPERFTLAQAQRLYEALRGEPVDPANFRRDVKATGLLADTGEQRSEGPGRPGPRLPPRLVRARSKLRPPAPVAQLDRAADF